MAGIVFAKFTKPTMRAETILFRYSFKSDDFVIEFHHDHDLLIINYFSFEYQ